ncbi:protein FAM174C [Xenentodon cancila]
MTFRRVLSVVLVPICWTFISVAEDASKAGGAEAPRTNVTSSGGGNSTHGSGRSPGGLFTGLGVDGPMIRRALYVLIAFTTVGVLYFLIRAVRLKKPASRKKYGLLSNYDDSVEMEAVESDEDNTLYEARSLRRSDIFKLET